MNLIKLTKPEFSAVLAGLRYLAGAISERAIVPGSLIDAIRTDCGEHDALGVDEITSLADRLNLGDLDVSSDEACPVCGSDCNERDEMTKMEREIDRLTALTPISVDELWAAQVRNWPDSVKVSFSDLVEWCETYVPSDGLLPASARVSRRWRSVALALQDPVHVFYRLKPGGPIAGCRYGLESHEYLSNYSDL